MLSASIPWSAAGAAALLLLAAPRSEAAGFALFEQGARAMGFAGAFTAQANDRSAIFHNAAGIAFLKARQIYVGGTLVAPASSFTGAAPFPGPTVTEESDSASSFPPTATSRTPSARASRSGSGRQRAVRPDVAWADPDQTSAAATSPPAPSSRASRSTPTVAFQLEDRSRSGGGLDVRLALGHARSAGARGEPLHAASVVDARRRHARERDQQRGGLQPGPPGASASDTLRRPLLPAQGDDRLRGHATFELRSSTATPQLDQRVRASLLPQGALPVSTLDRVPRHRLVRRRQGVGRSGRSRPT